MKRIIVFVITVCLFTAICANLTACDNVLGETEGSSSTTTIVSTTKGSTGTSNKNSSVGNNENNSNNQNNNSNNDNEENNSVNGDDHNQVNELDLIRYDLQKFVYPIWKSDVCFAEASFVRENADGVVEPLRLLYPIKSIVSVRSADLKTLYKEGVDYNITSDGNIEIIRTGSIPVLSYSDYHFPNYSAVADKLKTKFPAADNSGWGYIRAEIDTNNPGMSRWTIAVTYEHEGESVVNVPADKSAKFSKLITKLESGEDITVVSMGDSITYGWSSSSLVDIAPFSPSYNRMVCKFIEKKYNVDVTHKNIAVSGSASGAGENGGLTKVNAACEASPDLVIVAYGMNDGTSVEPATYINNINTIVSTIEQRCPDACIVVVGTCLPNAEVGYSAGVTLLRHHITYAEYLAEAEKNTWGNAAFADVTTANVELFERKVYQDVAGSNSNHPNDYMHRIYAQVVLQTMFGDYVD